MPNANPILDPSGAFSGTATGADIPGCRILTPAAAKTDGNALPVKVCGASDPPVGVSGADAKQNVPGGVTVYVRQVLRVESAGTIAAGAAVEVTATGKVQTLASGRRVGVAWEAATNGSFPLIQMQL
jgi:hypothetical protein